MKKIYLLVVILSVSLSPLKAQKIQTTFSLDFGAINFSTDGGNELNLGFATHLGFRFFIFDRLQFEAKPGVFVSAGDFNFSGGQLGMLMRYEIIESQGIYGIGGINWRFPSFSSEGHSVITVTEKSFEELVLGLRMGGESFGINFTYYHAFIDQIAVSRHEMDENDLQNICMGDTFQVGFGLSLFTIKNLFPSN